jgi:hypothetical protein
MLFFLQKKYCSLHSLRSMKTASARDFCRRVMPSRHNQGGYHDLQAIFAKVLYVNSEAGGVSPHHMWTTPRYISYLRYIHTASRSPAAGPFMDGAHPLGLIPSERVRHRKGAAAAGGRDFDVARAGASSAFSINSLTTLAGRSTTSPAAMRLTVVSESWRTGIHAPDSNEL